MQALYLGYVVSAIIARLPEHLNLYSLHLHHKPMVQVDHVFTRIENTHPILQVYPYIHVGGTTKGNQFAFSFISLFPPLI
jgi:hypothetical protein